MSILHSYIGIKLSGMGLIKIWLFLYVRECIFILQHSLVTQLVYFHKLWKQFLNNQSVYANILCLEFLLCWGVIVSQMYIPDFQVYKTWQKFIIVPKFGYKWTHPFYLLHLKLLMDNRKFTLQRNKINQICGQFLNVTSGE